MLAKTAVLVLALAAASASAMNMPCTFTKTIFGKEEKFDLSPLTINADNLPASQRTLEANWRAEEEGNTQDGQRVDYYYYMNVCASLVGTEDDNITMVQREKLNANNTYTVGRLPSTEIAGLRDGDLRLSMGRVPSWYNRQAVIVFFCEDVGLGEPYFVDEDANANGGVYNFVWNTCAACPLGSRIRNACPNKAGEAKARAAAQSQAYGLAIVTLLFVELGAYIIVGMAYKRLIKGAKGIEQIPNIDFWRSLMFWRQSGPKPNYDNLTNERDHAAHVDEEANNDDAMLRP